MHMLGDLVPTPKSSNRAEVPRRKTRAEPATSLSGAVAGEPHARRLELSRALAHEPGSIQGARDALDPLASAVDPESFDNLRLLVSELVTNSVRHSSPETPAPIELSVVAAPSRVRAEVADGGAGFAPAARTDEADEASGWGLHLVEFLSDRWGVEQDGRTAVWFELDAAFAPQWQPDDVIDRPPGENHRQTWTPAASKSPQALRRLGALRLIVGPRQKCEADVD